MDANKQRAPDRDCFIQDYIADNRDSGYSLRAVRDEAELMWKAHEKEIAMQSAEIAFENYDMKR